MIAAVIKTRAFGDQRLDRLDAAEPGSHHQRRIVHHRRFEVLNGDGARKVLIGADVDGLPRTATCPCLAARRSAVDRPRPLR